MIKTWVALLWLAVFLVLAPVVKAETIGVIITRDTPFYEEIHSSVLAHLSSRESNLKFVVQRPFPDTVAWSNAARKIMASGADVIVTYGAAATMAVLRERPNVPVVYAGVYSGAAAAIRGKKVYGVQSRPPLSSLVRYLKEARQIEKIAVVYNSREADSLYQFGEITGACGKYGISTAGIDLMKTADVAIVASEHGADALYITGSSAANAVYGTIINVARNQKLPVASLLYDKQKQPMMMLSPDPADEAVLAAGLIHDVLHAREPASPRVECRKFVLTYNLKSASDIGMKTSFGLLMDASEVVH
jgi:putative ABC transport system substrate-binding protein